MNNLKKVKVLGNRWLSSLNKFDVLNKATGVGLNVPPTIYTSEKNVLHSFLIEHERVITKPIGEVTVFFRKKNSYGMHTKLFDLEKLYKLPDKFGISLFQKYIEKLYEVRVFIIQNKIYSMAIFSQSNQKTKVDFRNYDSETPTRKVPYNLPEDVKNKLINLMTNIGLNTGSIDIIVDPEGDYYFLEVNPVGQFGFLQEHTNYNIYREIAQFLINKNE